MNQSTYKTRDLAEAAALVVLNQRIVNVERENRICWFIFENRKDCEQISDQFFFGKLNVPAREYYESIVRLKNRIFSN